jgi:hypothetical protein
MIGAPFGMPPFATSNWPVPQFTSPIQFDAIAHSWYVAELMSLDEWKSVLKEGLASVRRKNAVEPAAWLCAIVSLPCFFWAIRTSSKPVQIALFVIGVVPIALFVGAYLYFMITDPDRLHSEEFQLKSRSLSAVEAKGGVLEINPVDLTVNPIPSRKRLLDGRGEDTDD